MDGLLRGLARSPCRVHRSAAHPTKVLSNPLKTAFIRVPNSCQGFEGAATRRCTASWKVVSSRPFLPSDRCTNMRQEGLARLSGGLANVSCTAVHSRGNSLSLTSAPEQRGTNELHRGRL